MHAVCRGADVAERCGGGSASVHEAEMPERPEQAAQDITAICPAPATVGAGDASGPRGAGGLEGLEELPLTPGTAPGGRFQGNFLRAESHPPPPHPRRALRLDRAASSRLRGRSHPRWSEGQNSDSGELGAIS